MNMNSPSSCEHRGAEVECPFTRQHSGTLKKLETIIIPVGITTCKKYALLLFG